MKRSFNDILEDKLKYCCSIFKIINKKKIVCNNVFFKYGCILKIY